MPRIGFDLRQILKQILLAGFLSLVFEHFAVADHGAQRRAQFVTHIGEKLALGAVGFFGDIARRCKFLALHALFGDVGVGAEPADDLAFGIADRLCQRQKPAIFAVVTPQRKRVLPWLARHDRIVETLRDAVDQIGRMRLAPAIAAAHVTGRQARVFVPALVVPIDLAFAVSHPCELRNIIGERAEAIAQPCQFFRRRLHLAAAIPRQPAQIERAC